MANNCDIFQNIDSLFNNTPDEVTDSTEILIKFANNIINNPQVDKYRKIRVGNDVVSNKLLPVQGAIECLFDMGFKEDGEYFTFEEGASLKNLTVIRNEIIKRRKDISKGFNTEDSAPKPELPRRNPTQESIAQHPSMEDVETTGRRPLTIMRRPMYPTDIVEREAEFVRRLVTNYEHVLIYEDPNVQEKARSVVPVATLQANATSKLMNYQSADPTISVQDLLLLELLEWFKKSFFSWVNSPKCDFCRGDTVNVGMAQASDVELMWGANRVENYQCNICQQFTRFPRYNHPGKLLETRRGRCGEWANCFTLCCRALGFEARYILDWTDHVWTEVYSASQKRWLHCDPCENICDKPLTYEHGWKKQLSYVIAFSKDEVQDVTWRYSSQHAAVLLRRVECREGLLLRTIERLCRQRQELLSETRRNVLLQRLVVELVEFITPKVAGSGEASGRISGSLAWRLARGETHVPKHKHQSVVIKPTDDEIKQRSLHLKYCTATDKYERPNDKYLKSNGWESLVFECANVRRNVENDWKMVYLARNEGTASASISWKFDFSDKPYAIDTIVVRCQSKCYESGNISLRMCAGDMCVSVSAGDEEQVINDLGGETQVTLTVEMRGGEGIVAWQHTQLFRQHVDSVVEFPFDIQIHLKDL